MALIVGALPHSEWELLTPLLEAAMGWEPEQAPAPEEWYSGADPSADFSDDDVYLLLLSRPERCIANALNQGVDLRTAVALWQARAEQILGVCRQQRDQTALVDVKSACEAPQALLEWLTANRPAFKPFASLASQQSVRLGYIEDGDSLEHKLNLLLAAQAVSQSSSIQRLLADIEASTVPVANTASPNSSQLFVPRIDVISIQLQLQSEVERREAQLQALDRKYAQMKERYEQKLAYQTSEMEKFTQDKHNELRSLRQQWSEEKSILEKSIADFREKLSHAESEAHRQSVLVDILMCERAQLRAKVAFLQTSWLSWITFPARWVYYSGRNVEQLFQGRTHRRTVRIIEQSDLFDAPWYARQYPDVIEAGADPAEHYARYGAFEGRDPGPGFSSARYLTRNQDVAESGINPLVHYELHGKREGRSAY